MDVSVRLIGVPSEEHEPAIEERIITLMLRHADLNHAPVFVIDCDANAFRFFHEDHSALVDEMPAPPQGAFSMFASSLETGLSHLGVQTSVRLPDASELSDRKFGSNIFFAICYNQYSFWDGEVTDNTIQFFRIGSLSSESAWQSPMHPIEEQLMRERYPEITDSNETL